MKTANIMLALGGDSGNIVPKRGVTPSELAVLRAIHGDDAVTDIEPAGEDDRKSRDDIARLRETYGMARDANNTRIVDQLFPGIAARAFESFDELELPEEFFKPVQRVAASAEPKPAPTSDEPPAPKEKAIDDMSKTELLAEAKRRGVDVDPSAKKADILDALTKPDADETDAETHDEVEDDGIGAMPDRSNFLG